MFASLPRVFWILVVLLVLVLGAFVSSSAFSQSSPVAQPSPLPTPIPQPIGGDVRLSGKIDSVLLERLKTANNDEALPTAIWLYHDLPAAQQRYWDILAAKHPEVNMARQQQRGLPFLLDDPVLSDAIRVEYEALVRTELLTVVAPLVQNLRGSSIKARELDMLPSVEARLTPAQIYEVAKRIDVWKVFSVEAQGEPALDTATYTDRVPRVWASGYDGVGQIIAVVEPDNIADHPSLSLSRTYRTGVGYSDPDHADQVAMAAASTNPTYPGVARGATIMNAGMTTITMTAMSDSINWALDNSAQVVNTSFNYEHSPSIQWIDVAVDYIVRNRRAIIVTVAGNYRDETITSPGKGYNVITVGGSNNANTPDLSDDAMYYDGLSASGLRYGSAYINNIPTYLEKPEVVAPSQQISFPEYTGAHDGTSFAAPQVAGLAAVLIKHSITANPTHSLRLQPLAMKAILMASAVQNVEGDSRLSDQDGAGGINAILADEIAKNGVDAGTICSSPCWWSMPTTFTDPAEGGYRTRTFTAVPGERIRLVATWFSDVPQPPPYPQIGTDKLSTNFDLEVLPPGSNSSIATSSSTTNNYEIVEFVAPATGTYTVRIWKITSPSEANNEVAIAWSRQATFLPDVRRNYAGWTSTITIRNDGKFGRVVRTTFIRQNGTVAGQPALIWLNPGGSINVPFSAGVEDGFWGSAVIDGNEDVSAVVVHERANPTAWDAYPGVGYPDTEILVPLVHRNNSGWNSHLILQNAGGTPATVRLDFYALAGRGQNCLNQNFIVAGTFVLSIDATSLNCLDDPNDAYPNSFVGAVRIVSTNAVPLAVTSTQFKGPFGAEISMQITTNNRPFAATLQAPLVQNYNAGWISGINLQNGLSNANWFEFTYYGIASSSPCYGPFGIRTEGYGVINVFPAPPTGNGCPTVTSAELGNSQVAVAQVNQNVTNSNLASTYAAIGYPSKLAIVPRLRKDSGWQDGMQIRNSSANQTATVSLVYYNQNGSVNATRPPLAIGPRQAVTLLAQGGGTNQIPPGFNGSVVIMSTQPVAVVVNVWKSGAGGDEVGSYPAIHR